MAVGAVGMAVSLSVSPHLVRTSVTCQPVAENMDGTVNELPSHSVSIVTGTVDRAIL